MPKSRNEINGGGNRTVVAGVGRRADMSLYRHGRGGREPRCRMRSRKESGRETAQHMSWPLFTMKVAILGTGLSGS